MAVAGGATTAYMCRVIGGELLVYRTTTLRSECATVDDAVQRLARCETVTVAGGDMAELRRRLAAELGA